jgi:hypothetical protein
LTSQVSRQDVLDQLYTLGGPYKQREIQRAMLVVERYVSTVANRITQNTEILNQGTWHSLKPGDTDMKSGVRRCIGCGKVRNLSKYFPRSKNASAHGRSKTCIVCARPSRWPANRETADQYQCKACGKWKILARFPEAKRVNPRISMRCTECQGTPVVTGG